MKVIKIKILVDFQEWHGKETNPLSGIERFLKKISIIVECAEIADKRGPSSFNKVGWGVG